MKISAEKNQFTWSAIAGENLSFMGHKISRSTFEPRAINSKLKSHNACGKHANAACLEK